MAAAKSTPGGSSELVEIVDLNERPLLVMPAAEAQRQQLRHRRVSVLFFDAGERLLLTRGPATPSRKATAWDLPAQGPVFAGEARQDAALRLLREQLGLERPRVAACPPVARPFSRLTTVFRADAAHERPRLAAGMECLFADVDELAALVSEFSEMLAPSLLHALEQHLLPSLPLTVASAE